MQEPMQTIQQFDVFCSLSELKSKKFIVKWMESLRDELMAVWQNGEIRIFSSICPHFGGEFKYDKRHNQFVCKWHGFCFDGKQGDCRYPASKMKLRKYEYRLQSGSIEVLRP
jgi:nitrite reductase/ring-hydroxylating ferredoxin subunit